MQFLVTSAAHFLVLLCTFSFFIYSRVALVIREGAQDQKGKGKGNFYAHLNDKLRTSVGFNCLFDISYGIQNKAGIPINITVGYNYLDYISGFS